MSTLLIILALISNLATIFLWRLQRKSQSVTRALIVAAALLSFIVSCVALSVPYAWTRAPFIALGMLGLSGWLVVLAYPLIARPTESR